MVRTSSILASVMGIKTRPHVATADREPEVTLRNKKVRVMPQTLFFPSSLYQTTEYRNKSLADFVEIMT